MENRAGRQELAERLMHQPCFVGQSRVLDSIEERLPPLVLGLGVGKAIPPGIDLQGRCAVAIGEAVEMPVGGQMGIGCRPQPTRGVLRRQRQHLLKALRGRLSITLQQAYDPQLKPRIGQRHWLSTPMRFVQLRLHKLPRLSEIPFVLLVDHRVAK